ncbi:ECF RNA polymerase sigma factor SigW [Roseimaritima multifibrata]|uniref:ECF RNA polymerase sigma factor SigW n=1 Tax=Roseimaritima multifibrata TaxID=1930274 RepID=A0A517M989_9BACT|nr:RNA polymerase sigma factor [Roseimaritima multifibrata]QDS91456.1 ECF RNA polymerase sigma factor SigW [Roseimaritima multifibrata]
MGSLRRGAVYHQGVRRISDEVNVRCSYENVAEIVDAHADALLLFARQWSKVSAEDVVQEAFLRLVRRVKANDSPENVVAWLYSVIRNELITMHHKGQHSRAREESVATDRPMWFEPSVDTRLDASRAAEQLKILPIEQRETVVARIWGELSFEEIARLTKSSRSTVHRRYVSGLETLRKSLS